MPRPIATTRGLHLGEKTSSSVTPADPFDGDLVKVAQTVVNGIQNSTTTFGHATPNIVGTATGGDPPTDNTGVYIEYASTTSNGGLAGWVISTTIPSFRFANLPVYTFHFQTDDVTNVRYWVGFITVGNGSASTATPANFVAFRYITPTVGDTTWHAVTADGAATGTVTDTGVAVTDDTSYIMQVRVRSTSQVEFTLNGVLVATHTTNLPAASQQLGPTMGLNNGTSGAARRIRCGYMRGRSL